MNRRVLIVDDDMDSRTVAREALVRAGFDVDEAVDGIMALDLVKTKEPDVILLDLAMPRMNGWDTARQLKKDHIKAPIIALTAHALAGDRDKALQAGCDDYLAKPCDPSDVVRKVQQWAATPRHDEGGLT